MVERFVSQKDAIIATLAHINPTLLTMTLDEWGMLREACEVLKPFEELTVEISADRYVNIQNTLLLLVLLQILLPSFLRVTTHS